MWMHNRKAFVFAASGYVLSLLILFRLKSSYFFEDSKRTGTFFKKMKYFGCGENKILLPVHVVALFFGLASLLLFRALDI